MGPAHEASALPAAQAARPLSDSTCRCSRETRAGGGVGLPGHAASSELLLSVSPRLLQSAGGSPSSSEADPSRQLLSVLSLPPRSAESSPSSLEADLWGQQPIRPSAPGAYGGS